MDGTGNPSSTEKKGESSAPSPEIPSTLEASHQTEIQEESDISKSTPETNPSETPLPQENIKEDTPQALPEEHEQISIAQPDELPVLEDKTSKPSIISSVIHMGSNAVGGVVAQGLKEVKSSIIREMAEHGQKYLFGKIVNLAATAAPHITTTTRSICRQSYDFSDKRPVLSLFTPSVIATFLGAAVTYLGVKSDVLPSWGKALTIGAGAYFGALQLQAPLQFLRGKRFFMQQDHNDSPSLVEIFRPQPRVITKMINILHDLDLYDGFYNETNGTISVYGENSSDEDKRNVIRAIAREANVPVFFITKKDFANSPENPLNTILKISQKADSAAFAYNAKCSFVCFENFMELFNEYKEIRELITSIRSSSPIRPSRQIIFWGINQKESHDERFRDQFFSFKLQFSRLSEGSEESSLLKVMPQHVPSFKPIKYREEKKNELPCYETSDLTLEDITGGYPEAIEVIVHELSTDNPGQGADGILLWGKPGTGKTRLARALAGTFNVPFFNVKISRVLQEGANAGNFIMTLFENAHQKAVSDKSKYALIFFDECDSLLQPLSKITDPTIRSANVALRSQLSGFSQDKKVICIAAANSSPNKLDEALIRPGRLGTHIHFKLPNTQARQEVLSYYLSEKEDSETAKKIGEKFADDTQEFSQADLEKLIKDSSRWADAFDTSIEEQLPKILSNMKKSKARVVKDRSSDEAYGYSSSEEGEDVDKGKEEIE